MTTLSAPVLLVFNTGHRQLYRIQHQDEDKYISMYQQHNADLADFIWAYPTYTSDLKYMVK